MPSPYQIVSVGDWTMMLRFGLRPAMYIRLFPYPFPSWPTRARLQRPLCRIIGHVRQGIAWDSARNTL